MKPAVLMLYGVFRNHPWQEDIFRRPDDLQRELSSLGFGFDIAVSLHDPTGKDELPEVRVAENPIYDQATGVLREAYFKPGSIANYPSVIDHWVANFQDEVLQDDGTYQRTAYGVGLPADRLWNHKTIQTFGNHKEKMNAVIRAGGVGIATYPVLAYEQFVEGYGSAAKLLFKPQGGSYGQGITVFDDVRMLHAAIQRGDIPTNGFIQPYLRNSQPIKGVKPLTKQDAVLLKTYNQHPDRPREIRMHVITYTDSEGKLVTEAYPTMKVSEPSLPFMKALLGIGLDPACIGPGSFIHDKSVELAQAVCWAAGEASRPIPQYYGVFDWLIDGDVNDPNAVHVVDGNCRGPALPECSVPAREAFVNALVKSGQCHL